MKIRIGMAGYGLVGRYHFVPALRNSRYAELIGVCGSNVERCRKFAEEMGIHRCYKNYEEMLADSSIDAVLIATPNYLHCPQVISAAEAGKHILCEKPMAINMKEAYHMVEVCDKAGVIFMVAHHLRYKACNMKVKEMMSNGDMGRISTVRVRWSFNHTNAEPDKGWRMKKELAGGGQILNVNSHCVDLLIYLLGEPLKVSAFIQKEAGDEVEEGSVIVIEFADGIIGIAQGSYREETVPNNLEMFGSRCSLIVEGACSTDRHGSIRNLTTGDYEKVEFDESPYTVEIDHFAKAIMERFEPVSSGRKTLDTMRVLMASYQSAETGKHIYLKS